MIKLVSEKGIAINVHFIPMPMLTFFKEQGYNINDYPQAYLNYSHEISLPIYPQLTDEMITYVIDAIVEAYNKVI
jgi:dTDP-4-amino-4,6-dideoxygalactose transaminase